MSNGILGGAGSLRLSVLQNNSNASWIDLVSTWTSTPVEEANLTDGTVYRYTGDSVTYRYVPNDYDPSLDAFYSSFDGTTLTDLIVRRG